MFENERIRVWSMTLQPHGVFEFHQHHHDHIVLWPDAGKIQSQNLGDDDWGISQIAAPGFTMFKTVGGERPLAPHRVRNCEDKEVTHYIIELLERSPSRTELPGEPNDRGRYEA